MVSNTSYKLFQLTILPITQIILYNFCNLDARGKSKLAELESNVIFTPNHSAWIDVTVIPASLGVSSERTPLHVASLDHSQYEVPSILKSTVFNPTFFGLMGGITTKRNHGKYEKSLREHMEVLRDGRDLIVFPEGVMSRDGKISPPRNGISYLAHESNKPVIPVAISGLYDFSVTKMLRGDINISVKYGSPIYFKDVIESSTPSREEYSKFSSTVMNRVNDLLLNSRKIKQSHEA